MYSFRASYSQGESRPVNSDAQTIDLGGNLDPNQPLVQTVAGGSNGGSAVIDVNSTPENITSAFGAVFYPFGGLGMLPGKVRPVAIKKSFSPIGKRAGATNGQVPTNVGANFQDEAGLHALPGIASQNQSTVRRVYRGQL